MEVFFSGIYSIFETFEPFTSKYIKFISRAVDISLKKSAFLSGLNVIFGNILLKK